MAARNSLQTNRSKNLTASKQLKTENEPKTGYSASTQSSQNRAMQAASKQLTNKPNTPNLRRRGSFGQDKTLKGELSGSGRQVKSSKSVPDLSESKYLSAAQKTSSTAMHCQRPTMAPTPTKTRLSQCSSTQKTHGASQNITIKKYKEENEGSDLSTSMEQCIRKLKGARVVPSRFRQAAAMRKKVVNKGHEKSSASELKRLNAEKKHLDLHSTGLEEGMLMPSLNWDLSAVKSEYSPVEVPECPTIMESTLVSPPLSEEDEIDAMDFDELLFFYMTTTRENYLEKYQENAERNLLLLEEQNQRLGREIFEYKQKYIMWENKKQLNSIIDQQMDHFKQVAPRVQLFKIQYKSLAQALDATRHSLQVKNIYMSEDPREDLEKLKMYLETTQQLLNGLGLGIDKENTEALAAFKELGVTVQDTDKEMKSFIRKIEEMASCISRETALLHQELDVQIMGMDVSAKGIFKYPFPLFC
ncbi:HAUS augmin-like complex subunit 8 isoform X2 [Pristis pectinata]|uniref:HAUS augmin-like complex subunit 8 isoform X2 n=1 Tax=Pristis pectinata TaxID=685728 RepID=UPI00223D4FC6|nr:HAUS augmin-like complex subunit 8 isoform X2 [Pristis pectinata]